MTGQPPPLGTILSVWAHPDDETYLAGGIMAQARDHGQRVVCVSATAGEKGTDEPDVWPPARLGPVRRFEAAAAMAVLGVGEHSIRGMPDGALPRYTHLGLVWARKLLEQVRPDTILTFGPDGMTYHPDHIAVHRWVTQAWLEGGSRSRLLYAATSVEHNELYRSRLSTSGIYMSDQRPDGIPTERLAVRMRLAGPALDRKLAALRAMATQTRDLHDRLGADVYAAFAAEESFVEAAAHLSSAAGLAFEGSRPA